MPGHSERQRAANRRAVLGVLTREGPASRADLARHTGLSATAVTSLVRDLVSDGLVVDSVGRGTPHKGGSGRPPTLLALAAPSGTIAGIDVGHRHVRVALADRTGAVLDEDEQDLDADERGPRTLDVAHQMVRAALERTGSTALAGVGLCVPAPLDRQSARISTGILPGWRGVVPSAVLEERLGVPVIADNDANLGALAEVHHGAARGVSDVVYVKLASGVGAGIVLGGRVHRGATGQAGEIGHVQVREDGRVCRCGNRGCLETEVSTRELLDLLGPAYDEPLTPGRLLALEAEGDAGCRRVLGDTGRTIGRALADLCNSLNPALIVLGGPFGSSSSLNEGVRAAVDRYAQPDTAGAVRVVPGELGMRAEVRGALDLALARIATAD